MASTAAMTSYSGPIVDPHMHQWDTVGKTRENNNSLLGDLGCYLAGEYSADFVSAGINIESAVHVEAFPNDQVLETDFLVGLIESGASPIRGIVANANLSMQREGPDSKSQQGDGLQALEDILQGHLKAGKGYVKGIRWVLNHEPSWPQVHRGDYFTDPQFAAGFAMLAKHGLAFDVQANPHQFKGAAAFFAEHPDTTVVINHMGCLKLSAAGEDASGDEAALAVWREGMAAMAALPNVYIKLSMLSYTVKEFWKSDEQVARVAPLVHETVALFGAKRCMFASNFPVDGLDGCTGPKLYETFFSLAQGYSVEEQASLFKGAATEAYKL